MKYKTKKDVIELAKTRYGFQGKYYVFAKNTILKHTTSPLDRGCNYHMYGRKYTKKEWKLLDWKRRIAGYASKLAEEFGYAPKDELESHVHKLNMQFAGEVLKDPILKQISRNLRTISWVEDTLLKNTISNIKIGVSYMERPYAYLTKRRIEVYVMLPVLYFFPEIIVDSQIILDCEPVKGYPQSVFKVQILDKSYGNQVNAKTCFMIDRTVVVDAKTIEEAFELHPRVVKHRVKKILMNS